MIVPRLMVRTFLTLFLGLILLIPSFSQPGFTESDQLKTLRKGKVAFQPPTWVGWRHDQTTAMSPLSVDQNVGYPS